MKTSVALIGFMGTGKSVVSKGLAARLGKKLVQVDRLIEQKAGKSVPRIFKEEGEAGFRELEISAIEEAASGKDQVIDCGGGVVLNQINIDRLKQEAIIVWLTATPGIIQKRTKPEKGARPLLEGKNRTSHIEAMLSYRKIFYEQAADIRIDTSKLEVEAVIERIIEKLKENADFNP